MVITDPTTARGIFYKLAQEFEEMDRRKKNSSLQIEDAGISKLKFETHNAIPEHKPWGYYKRQKDGYSAVVEI
jgi:hypothetical protein